MSQPDAETRTWTPQDDGTHTYLIGDMVAVISPYYRHIPGLGYAIHWHAWAVDQYGVATPRTSHTYRHQAENYALDRATPHPLATPLCADPTIGAQVVLLETQVAKLEREKASLIEALDALDDANGLLLDALTILAKAVEEGTGRLADHLDDVEAESAYRLLYSYGRLAFQDGSWRWPKGKTE